MSSRELSIAAMKLPPKRRAKLAEMLLTSLEGEAQRKINTAWGNEAESRIDEIDSGSATSKPLSAVLRRLKTRKRR